MVGKLRVSSRKRSSVASECLAQGPESYLGKMEKVLDRREFVKVTKFWNLCLSDMHETDLNYLIDLN